MLDCALYIYVLRPGFGSVNPEIYMIEGQIINVLLYLITVAYYSCTFTFLLNSLFESKQQLKQGSFNTILNSHFTMCPIIVTGNT